MLRSPMKITRAFPSLLALAAGFVLASGTARATPIPSNWAGNTLDVQVLDPNPGVVYFDGDFPVPSVIRPYQLNTKLVLSITPTQVSFTNTSGSVPNKFLASSTIKITDDTVGAPPIINVQVDPATNVNLFSRVLFGRNFLQFDLFDLANTTIPPLGTLVFDVGFGPGSPSPVPEPASLALLGTALLGLLTVRHLRRIFWAPILPATFVASTNTASGMIAGSAG